MKVLKKINLQKLSDDNMNHLKGGSMSDVNNSSGCTCSGSDQGWFWCNDNNNNASDCYCQGTNNNKNSVSGCSCGG